MSMPRINRRQAQVVEGAVAFENPNGTAPGQWIDVEGRVVILLPGPPRELGPMVDGPVMDRLRTRVAGHRLVRRSVRIVGPTESHAEERLQPLYARWSELPLPVSETILAARGQIELQLTVRSDDAALAEATLERAVTDVEQAFGLDVCSRTGAVLEVRVGELLRARGWKLALAESCTGGLVTSRLVDVAGSSDYVERAYIVYSNQAKVDDLGVPAALLAAHGAVSEPVAAAMADGARRASGADIAVAITGIAGPGGGTPDKPVGTVVIAVSDRSGRATARTRLLPGDRTQVRWFASTLALDAVRRVLLDE
jgi:nicotinamide-nucleotide amidase